MNGNCIFCKIIRGEIQSKFVYEDEFVVAFNDISPQAPLHLLFVPKKHIKSLNDIKENDEIMLHVFKAILKYTKQIGIKEYRTVINTGKESGQEVLHLHVHVLSGRDMNWPPG